MNRLVSNFILGFFALALMAVYGFAKQPTVYSMMMGRTATKSVATTQTDGTVRRVVMPNGTTIAARVADTDETRAKGLAGVERLDDNSGMLFAFSTSGTYSMWMKGMNMSIDILWLDEQGKVVHLAAQVPAPVDDQADLPTYVNDQPAKYVLELAAGEAEKTGIKEGDTLKLS